MISLVVLFGIAAVIAYGVTPAVRRAAFRVGALDHPGARKAHATSTPRLGGASVGAAWAGTVALAIVAGRWIGPLAVDAPIGGLLLGAAIVFTVGAWDDVWGLPAGWKLFGEALAAAAVLGSGIEIERVTVMGTTWHLGLLGIAVTIAWILTMTNAFNLIDGLDGLATGLAIIAGATCTSIVLIRGDTPTAVVLLALLGGLVGFLPYNFSPATIFLGDSGSLLIGFILSVTAITGFQKGATALAAGLPLLIFALPILDTIGAVARRLAGGGRSGGGVGLAAVFRADRRHIHHYLVAQGLSPRTAVLVLYAAALLLSVLALATMNLH